MTLLAVFFMQFWVVSQSGIWHTGAKAPIAAGLAAGDEIVGSEKAAITLLCGPSRITYTCLRGGCHVKACDKQSADGSALVQVVSQPDWIGAAMKALFSREPRYQILGTRGSELVPDTVVRQQGEQVLFGPALSRLRDGPLCFTLGELPETGAPARQFDLDWDSDDPVKRQGAVLLAGLPPGTYTLRWGVSAAGACRLEESAGPAAWVLVARDSDFPEVSQRWQRLLPDVEQVGDQTNPETERALRHALLGYLADSLHYGR